MSHARSVLLKAAVLTLSMLMACERSAPAVGHDSVRVVTHQTTDSAPTPTPESVWNDAAGPVLLVQGETNANAIVILSSDDDSTHILSQLGKPGKEVALFGRNGVGSKGQLGGVPRTNDAECREWPVQHGEGVANWSLGFISRSVVGIALDSLEGASSRDSSSLTTEAARLASLVTALTSPSFEGLRFVVHEVRRFEISPGVQALVAHVIRRVNQEANPQEEQTLIIAERDSGSTSGPYQLVYADRAHGLEEQVVAPEVIAAVMINGRPTLVVARDSDDGVSYELLERDASRHWRIRWISTPTRCG